MKYLAISLVFISVYLLAGNLRLPRMKAVAFKMPAAKAGRGWMRRRLQAPWPAVAGGRRRRMDRQLPDTLEVVANALRAGLSLPQALDVAARETASPLADEFAAAVRDCRLGLSPGEALEKMFQRWPNPDLELFIVAVDVCQRTGGNLAEVSGRLIATVRERFRLKGRMDALTAQGRLSGWVVGLMPAGLLLAMTLLDPETMAAFFRHPLGWLMLAAGAVMELVGAFFIKKIVDIEV